MSKQELTKETFKEIFDDNFAMTNYIIKLAQQQIHAGNEELSVTELLREVRKHPPTKEQVESSTSETHE